MLAGAALVSIVTLVVSFQDAVLEIARHTRTLELPFALLILQYIVRFDSLV